MTLADGVHRVQAEGTRLIDVGAIAGTGLVGGATVATSGAPAGIDDGTFGKTLKASVDAAPAVAVVAAEGGGEKGKASAAKAGDTAVAVSPGLTPGTGSATSLLETATGKVAPASAESGDLGRGVLAKGQVNSGKVWVAAGVVSGSTPKVGKNDGAPGIKKVAAKSGEAAVDAAAAVQQPGVGAAAVSGTASVVTVQIAASVPQAVNAKADGAPVAAAADGESGKGAKVGGVRGFAKSAGREGKTIEVGLATNAKEGVGATANAGLPGSGSGLAMVKDSGGGVQSGVGVSSIVPVSAGAGASHAGIAGVGMTKGPGGSESAALAAGSTGAAGQEVRTLAATPTLLEVGVESGTHGWLRVRAEMGQTGEVTASMVAATAGQADTLRRELPAISTYLAAESVGVSSLVVNATGAGAGAQDAAMNLGAGAQSGGDGQAQRSGVGSQSGGGQGSGAGLQGEGGVDVIFSGGELPSAMYANGSGSWLSVRV